jgi:hypothetical protein
MADGQRWWSPARIRPTWLRRLALVAATPVIISRSAPLLWLLPFWIGWWSLVGAWRGAADALRWELASPDLRLLGRGLRLIWHPKYHTDFDAALAEVKRGAET